MKRLEDAQGKVELAGPPPGLGRLPTDWAQDAIGAQAIVIIVFLARLLYRVRIPLSYPM